MAEIKFIDENGVLYLWQKIQAKLADKVDKIDGKGLSTNDFTNELLEKLISLTPFSGDYNDLINKPIIPSKVSDLTNDNNYQSATEVNAAITQAISGITQFNYSIVNELPEIGVKGTIYLISNSGSGTNIYDEYLWLNDKWELFGTTAIDLSGYIKDTDLVPITNAEIDEIFAQ